MKLTAVNLSALVDLVIATGGAEVSARLRPTDRPHVARCLALGLVTPSGPPGALTLTLTSLGRGAVLEALRERVARFEGEGYTGSEFHAKLAERARVALARFTSEG